MRKMAAAAVQKTKDANDMRHHLCHVMSARKIECRLRKRGIMEVYFVPFNVRISKSVRIITTFRFFFMFVQEERK